MGDRLVKRGQTVVTAESCTGGLIAQRLTAVPGSSAYFLGGVVTYSDALKHQLLEVPLEEIAEPGAVSSDVVRRVAVGAQKLLGADYALAVSGIAGPGGGTVDKPVGLVYVGLAGEGEPLVQQLHLPGNRERIRRMTSQWALDLLRRELLESSADWEATADGRERPNE